MMATMASGRSVNDPVQNLAQSGKPKRLGRSARFLSLLQRLERDRKIRKTELYELLAVRSHSSFKRIKAELARAGLPITYDRGDGHYHVPVGATCVRHGIDTRTRAQLAQVRAAVNALGGVAQDALEDVLEMLDARIALDDPTAVAVVSSRHPQPSGGADFYEALDRALSAVREHRWLSFVYERTAGGESTVRTIAPYAVHSHDGRYYVWGTLEGDASSFPAPRLFALDRMSDVAIEEDSFTFDASLDLDDSLRQSFGTMVSTEPAQEVVVDIASEAAAFVSCRRWPAQTSMRANPDGSLRLTFMVSKIDEIIAWVLSFGGAATIVSPPSAREELRQRATSIVQSATD
jgi:predicted DNA-binding transcriptional regulator YafY